MTTTASADYSYAHAAEAVAAFRAAHPGAKIGFTAGVFDLIHAGHATMLQTCRSQCDYLVVLITNDAQVRESKSKGSSIKPVVTERDRATMVDALKTVDLTVIREPNDAFRERILNDIIKPDIYFAGPDQKTQKFHKSIPENCEVRKMPPNKEYSTTSYIQKILAAKKTDDAFQSGKQWHNDREWYR